MRWLGYFFPVLVLCAAILLIVWRGSDLVNRRGPRVEAESGALTRAMTASPQAVFASPSAAAVAPSRNFDDVLWRVDRLKGNDQPGYEALLDQARALVARDEAAFLSYFRRAMRSTNEMAARRAFFLVKVLLVTVPAVSGPVRDLLALKEPLPPHGAPPPTLAVVKTFALDQLVERLPSETEQQRLSPTLERIVRSEPDLAVARSASVLLTRIRHDDGAAVRRLSAGRSAEERAALADEERR